jgi:hypothetical protein
MSGDNVVFAIPFKNSMGRMAGFGKSMRRLCSPRRLTGMVSGLAAVRRILDGSA